MSVKKTAPVAEVTKSAPVPAPVAEKPKAAPKAKAESKPVLQAPKFVVGPWPVKSQSGNSIRAYCYSVAKKLEKQQGSFTVRELAAAFAASAEGTTFKQPGGGWGTEQKPNGTAMTHANWFANTKQGWLAPAKESKAE